MTLALTAAYGVDDAELEQLDVSSQLQIPFKIEGDDLARFPGEDGPRTKRDGRGGGVDIDVPGGSPTESGWKVIAIPLAADCWTLASASRSERRGRTEPPTVREKSASLDSSWSADKPEPFGGLVAADWP